MFSIVMRDRYEFFCREVFQSDGVASISVQNGKNSFVSMRTNGKL